MPSSGAWWMRLPCRSCWRAKRCRPCSRPSTATSRCCSSFFLTGDQIIALTGCDADEAKTIAQSSLHEPPPSGLLALDGLGADAEGPRRVAIAHAGPPGHLAGRRQRMLLAVARQGFALCEARERPVPSSDTKADPSLEPLLPGFLCVSASMQRVAEQIKRLQVTTSPSSSPARAAPARSSSHARFTPAPRAPATFLPYNCTTTGARSGRQSAVRPSPRQLHRRGGGSAGSHPIGRGRHAVPRRDWRSADRRAAQAAALPRAGRNHPDRRARPAAVDVRVLAATNADLEQRVDEGDSARTCTSV